MRKVFWDNPYQHTLATKVETVNGNIILFEETIVYSFAGGQESDKATIKKMDPRVKHKDEASESSIAILDSKREGNLIFYTLPEGHGLQPNDNVIMQIDWPRRHRLMRLHFTAELILEIVTQKYGYEKVGAHIAENKARIDFKTDQNISQYFDEILKIYNDIIAKNLPIQKDWSDEATQRRFWKIEGFAQVPCGGTHVDTTGEVGFVTLKRERQGKGIERIQIYLVNDSI